jgi:hypothetical protein
MLAFETEAVLENSHTLRLNMPVLETSPMALRVILLMEKNLEQETKWPEGFFEKNYGNCASDPLVIPSELPLESNRLPLG